MSDGPPRLRLADGRGITQSKLAASLPPALALLAVVDGDVPTWVRIVAVPALIPALWVLVATWRQHVVLHAGGLATRRIVWRETTPWADIRAVVLAHTAFHGGPGWRYLATLRDGRTAPRETFGEFLLRPADRDRMIAWITAYAPQVDVTIDAGWPRRGMRSHAGRHRISIDVEDGRYVAVARLTDGAEVERGEPRRTVEDAIADGSSMLVRHRDEA